MLEVYTLEASDTIFDLLDRDIADIWADIDSTPDTTDAERWRMKMKKIAASYTCSGRFALMRILCSRAGEQTPEAGFEAVVNGSVCRFPDISPEHAASLTPEEHIQYMDLLRDIASRQPDSNPEVNERIIRRAWLDHKSADMLSEYILCTDTCKNEVTLQKERSAYKKANKALYKTRLTRDEAFLLGHILNFTPEEMQWYLLRVLIEEDGFRYNMSNDLIELYGFMSGASWQHVLWLKEQYAERSAHISKKEDAARNKHWTQSLSGSLFERVEGWKRSPETMDAEFLNWITDRASGLDIPSRTAARVYRNLAIFAYDLVTGEEHIPDEDELLDSIEDVCGAPEESGAVYRNLYQDGKIAPSRCKDVANALLLENKIQSASIQKDNTKAWHILSIRDDGEISTAGGLVNIGRSRVADILSGTVQAEKGDLLYLLWFTANLIWQGADSPDTNALCCRIMNFMDSAKFALEEALLPEFYPPHLMEQSMLLSIVYSGKQEEDPSVVYEYISSILTTQRVRQAGAQRHTDAQKVEIVRYYRSHPELSLDECANQYGISPKTLSAWQQTLLKEGKVQ